MDIQWSKHYLAMSVGQINQHDDTARQRPYVSHLYAAVIELCHYVLHARVHSNNYLNAPLHTATQHRHVGWLVRA